MPKSISMPHFANSFQGSLARTCSSLALEQRHKAPSSPRLASGGEAGCGRAAPQRTANPGYERIIQR